METKVRYNLPNAMNALIPMSFGGRGASAVNEGTVMAGDVGGTKTNLAIYAISKGHLKKLKQGSYATGSYPTFLNMVGAFRTDGLPPLDGICLGVAGTIAGQKVHGTNFPWNIDADEIGSALKVGQVALINDMEANAFGLASLEQRDFTVLKSGTDAKGNAAMISPGTGLGESGLFWDGAFYRPFASEGGHCDFSVQDDLDHQLWLFLHRKFGHVSWERVVSGQGIRNIYDFLVEYQDIRPPTWLSEKMEKEDIPTVISHTALEDNDATCSETIRLFLKYLAIESAQLALKVKAVGGVFIGGGILPKIDRLVDPASFLEYFVKDGRMDHILQDIPVRLVMNDKTALLGAAYYAAMSLGPAPKTRIKRTKNTA